MTISTAMVTETRRLLRLQSWLSPAFPIGAFSYSHGLEFAVEAALVQDRNSLADWLDADLRYGSGRQEAVIVAAALAADDSDLFEIAELAAASFGTSELALEGLSQGEAFLRTVLSAWPDQGLQALARSLTVESTLAIAFALTCRTHDIKAVVALPLYLQAWLANLINAAVRLVPLGQTDGQLAQAALEAAVIATAQDVEGATLDELGSAALMVDWASSQHESQYTRLFRS